MLTYYLEGEDKEQRARRMGHSRPVCKRPSGDAIREERNCVSTSNLDGSSHNRLFCLAEDEEREQVRNHRVPPFQLLSHTPPQDVFPDSPSTQGLPSPGLEGSETLYLLPSSPGTLPHPRRTRSVMWDDRRTNQSSRSLDLGHSHMNGRLPESVL